MGPNPNNTLRVALAQTPVFTDDIHAALHYMQGEITQSISRGARLICFPEAFLQGYLTATEDAAQCAIDLAGEIFERLLHQLPDTDAVVVFGLIECAGGNLFNTAVAIQNHKVIATYHKTNLLKREAAFTPGTRHPIIEVDGFRFGFNICHDTNFASNAKAVRDGGGYAIICLANNMLPRAIAEKYRDVHHAVRAERCRETGLWMLSSDVTGDTPTDIGLGPTAVLNPEGELISQLALGRSGLLIYDLPCIKCQLAE